MMLYQIITPLFLSTLLVGNSIQLDTASAVLKTKFPSKLDTETVVEIYSPEKLVTVHVGEVQLGKISIKDNGEKWGNAGNLRKCKAQIKPPTNATLTLKLLPADHLQLLKIETGDFRSILFLSEIIELYAQPKYTRLTITGKNGASSIYENDDVVINCETAGAFPKKQLKITPPFGFTQTSNITSLEKETLNGKLMAVANGQEVKCIHGPYSNVSKVEVFSGAQIGELKSVTSSSVTPGNSLICTASGHPKPEVTWTADNRSREAAKSSLSIQGDKVTVLANVTAGSVFWLICTARNTLPNGTVVTDTVTQKVTVTQDNAGTDPNKVSMGSTTGVIVGVCLCILLIIAVAGVVSFMVKKKRQSKANGLNKEEYKAVSQQPDDGRHSARGKPEKYDVENARQQNPGASDQNGRGVEYAELNFSDMPRSRKPIQVVDDKAKTEYCEIVGVMQARPHPKDGHMGGPADV